MKNLLVLLPLVLPISALAGKDAVIWGGGGAILLPSSLQIGNATTSPILQSGAVDPSSSSTSANKGSIYMSTNGNNYIKTDNGASTNWSIMSSLGSGGTVSGTHFICSSSAPSIAVVTAGAGANATASISGTDCAGTITLNTSALDTPGASSNLATITFATAYASAPRVIVTPSNDVASALAFGVMRCRQSDVTTTAFTLRSGTVPLTALTAATYTWNYSVTQ